MAPNQRYEPQQPADRAYWEKRSHGETALEMVDGLFGFIKGIDSTFAIGYNLGYIQINKGGRDFLICAPRLTLTRLRIIVSRTSEADEIADKLKGEDVDVQHGERSYLLLIKHGIFMAHFATIKELVALGLRDWEG